MSLITKSPFTIFDKGLEQLQLYKFGRKPFVWFAIGLALTQLVIHFVQSMVTLKGVKPTYPEWKTSMDILQVQMRDITKKLIYGGSFVLGVSQAVKKQKSVLDPDLTYVILYGKLLLVLFTIEFICGILTRKEDNVGQTIIKWIRELSGDTAREMVNGASTGFGYGYMIRGVGYLFGRYELLVPS